jgi:hypothetical protein
MIPERKLRGGAGIIAGLVESQQRAARQILDAEIIGEIDQRIELVLGGRRTAQGSGDLRGEADEVLLEARVALCLGLHRILVDVRSGGAPADRPGQFAGAGVGIGLEAAAGLFLRAAFELVDERHAIRAGRHDFGLPVGAILLQPPCQGARLCIRCGST